MRKPVLLFITVVLIISASWLTFFDHNRYGIHGDGFECGQVKDTVTSYTATTYYAFSESLQGGQALNIGTCPYNMFKAKTYALDLWIPAILLGYLSYKNIRTSRKRRVIH